MKTPSRKKPSSEYLTFKDLEDFLKETPSLWGISLRDVPLFVDVEGSLIPLESVSHSSPLVPGGTYPDERDIRIVLGTGNSLPKNFPQKNTKRS